MKDTFCFYRHLSTVHLIHVSLTRTSQPWGEMLLLKLIMRELKVQTIQSLALFSNLKTTTDPLMQLNSV